MILNSHLKNRDPPITEVYCTGSVLLTKRPNNSNSLADVFLAKLDMASNNVIVEDLIREVEITSLKSMTQSEYIGFTADSNAIPLIT